MLLLLRGTFNIRMKKKTMKLIAFLYRRWYGCSLLWLFGLFGLSMIATELRASETYSFALNRVSFEKAVNAIEVKTHYSFVFKTETVDNQTVVDIIIKNATIDGVVKELIKGLLLEYEIKGKRIFLMKKNVRSTSDSGQQQYSRIIITGRVTDENGEPLIGATVSVQESNSHTITDMNGNYSISVPANIYVTAKLMVSYVGFKSVSKSLKGHRQLNIVLESDTQLLSDVVIVGYGTQKKESLTSAISTVGSDDISRSAATNTSGALVGKIAGINSRMSDGRPGASTTLNIRNMGTPLYVVDGVQMEEGQFNNIDFNDIESISVLKDASAAIYGVRAANGVVVVKTKSGKRNSPNRINVNMYYGWQNMMRFPKPADAETYVEAQVHSATIQGTTGKYSYEDLIKWRAGTEKGYRPFDWYDFIFGTAPQYYVSANTSGGSDKINYYLAVSHLQQDAIINNYGNFNRTNIQMNIDANITKKFKIGASINGRIQETVHPAISMNDGNDDYWTALFATYRNLPTIRPYANDNPLYPAQTSPASYTNFAIFGQTGEQRDRWKVIQSTFSAEYEVIKNLKLKGIFSYFYSNRRYDNQENSYKLYSYNENTDTYSTVVDLQGRFRERDIRNNEEINTQINASYDALITDAHKIIAFVGAETYKRSTPGFYLSSNPASNALKLLYVDDIKVFNDEGDNTQARAGFMGRLNYEYKSKYLLEVAARYDGSWKFPPNHRWGFFPSVSAGWRVSEEKFWSEDLKRIVSNLKLRGSYGMMGDDNVWGYAAFDFLEGYNYKQGGAVIDGEWVVGSQVRALAVTNLSWIKSKIVDVGVDFGFFDNRLTGSLDFFRRLRTGLPAARYDKILPSELGFDLPYENLNSDVQKGIDGSLNWQSTIGDFSYKIGGNFTFSRAYNWHQYKPVFGNSRDYYVYSSNERVAGTSWSLECIGQFQSWEQIANWPVDIDGKGNTTLRPGDLIYEDRNGDMMITDEDQHPVGYQQYESGNTPVINFAFNLGFSWKGMDFSCDLTGAAKSTFWFNYEQRTPFWGETNSPQYYLEDQWHLTNINDPNSELIPGRFPTALVGNATHSNYTASTFWMRNVRYLKLRNLELGYSFPTKWLQKVKVEKLRVYTLMQNLFSIDNVHDRGVDPEIAQPAGFAYPTNRVINVGLNVTF